jgi:hypothetical protein
MITRFIATFILFLSFIRKKEKYIEKKVKNRAKVAIKRVFLGKLAIHLIRILIQYGNRKQNPFYPYFYTIFTFYRKKRNIYIEESEK